MISFIICSVNNARFRQVESHLKQLAAEDSCEIIRIPDARSMCEGYNRGLQQSKGDFLVFCHDDIEFLLPDSLTRIQQALTKFDIIGVAGTNRLDSPRWISAGPGHIFGAVAHPGQPGRIGLTIFGAPRRAVPGIQALDGLFIACRREVALALPWDQETFTRFHHYDLDWTFRASRAGYKLAVLLDLPILHRSPGNYNAPEWKASAAIFLKKHQAALATSHNRQFGCSAIMLSSRTEVLGVLSAVCQSIDGLHSF